MCASGNQSAGWLALDCVHLVESASARVRMCWLDCVRFRGDLAGWKLIAIDVAQRKGTDDTTTHIHSNTRSRDPINE